MKLLFDKHRNVFNIENVLQTPAWAETRNEPQDIKE